MNKLPLEYSYMYALWIGWVVESFGGFQ